jgi:hypothetical protein
MPIDPSAFRFAGSIVFGELQRERRFSLAITSPLIRVTPILGRAKAGKSDNRKNWNRAGGIRQVDFSGAVIRDRKIGLRNPTLFRPDRDLSPYWVESWRPPWVWPLTLKIEVYTRPLGDESDYEYDLEVDLDFE